MTSSAFAVMSPQHHTGIGPCGFVATPPRHYNAPMNTDQLDYDLPPASIAARPAEPRDHSRLLVYHQAADRVEHRHFYDLPEYLRPTDLLIVNDTRVIPAKLELQKITGGAIPGLFLAEESPGTWRVLLRSRGKIKPGDPLTPHAHGLPAMGQPLAYHFTVTARVPNEKGTWLLSVTPPHPAPQILATIGHVPLPPYLEKMRDPDTAPDDAFDRAHYQTVYARDGRSLAAPTAGLHFTPELLATIAALGVRRAPVTLEVGLGTFLPVETPTLEAHPMHTESYAVPPETAAAIRTQRASVGARIVVVGTTAVRTLEAAADAILAPPAAPIAGQTQLLISPGYTFRLTDVLITNFHLPRSTLLALVAARMGAGGLDKLKSLYAIAVTQGYRFYSYGDAMLLLP